MKNKNDRISRQFLSCLRNFNTKNEHSNTGMTSQFIMANAPQSILITEPIIKNHSMHVNIFEFPTTIHWPLTLISMFVCATMYILDIKFKERLEYNYKSKFKKKCKSKPDSLMEFYIETLNEIDMIEIRLACN